MFTLVNKITNMNVPACINCKNFKEHPNNYTYNDVPDKTIHLSKCAKFGEKNMITGQIKYMFAEVCRIDRDLCGKEAKYFEDIDPIHMR